LAGQILEIGLFIFGEIMKKYIIYILLLSLIGIINGCTDAEVASYNLSKDADMFRINRRIVFVNGITDKYIMSIEGLCSVDFYPEKFTVTCKTGPNTFKKHYLGRADNVFPFVEQLDSAPANIYHYKIIFKPSVILPDIELLSQD